MLKRWCTVITFILSTNVIPSLIFAQECNPHCYLYANLIWHFTSVNYYINNNMAIGSTTQSDWTTAIEAASNTWNAAGSAFYFNRNLPDISTNWYNSPGYNVVGWEIVVGGDLANTINTIDPQNSSFIVETDTWFNQSTSTYTWSTNPSTGEHDIQSAAVHEFGHWSWLGDEYEVGCENNVMFHDLPDGITRRILTQDDKFGHQKNYPITISNYNFPQGSLIDVFQRWDGKLLQIV